MRCLCVENLDLSLLAAVAIENYSYIFICNIVTIMGKNDHPVVVEGTSVPHASPYDHTTTATATATAVGGTTGGGEKQETRCRDPAFALLLYGNVGAIAAVAAIYGSDAFTQAISETDAGENSASGYSYTGYMYATFILSAIAMVFTGITLPIMMCIPTLLIKVSLLLMLVLSGLMMAYFFVLGNIIGGIFGVSKTRLLLFMHW
jgi:hypothetical protein